MGAAGPLMCIITLYTLYNPRREISLFFVVTLEMRLVLAIYVAFMVIPILVSPSGAAVRGFSSQLVGLGYAFAFRGLDLRLGRLKQLWPGRIRRFRVVSPPEVTPREKSSPRPASGPIGGASPSWTSPSGANPANIFSGSGRGSSAGGTSTVVVTQEQLEARLDELLVKIAREGKASLTEEETRILEEASRRARSRRSERI
jgi:hypothetical protein